MLSRFNKKRGSSNKENEAEILTVLCPLLCGSNFLTMSPGGSRGLSDTQVPSCTISCTYHQRHIAADSFTDRFKRALQARLPSHTVSP